MTPLSPSSPAERMSDFDSLPPAIRQALASATFSDDPVEIRRRLNKGRSAERILRAIIAIETRRRQ